MSIIEFSFKGSKTQIQCNEGESIKDSINRFCSEIGVDNNSLLFLYGADNISEETEDLTFEEFAKEFDKQRKKINILAYEKDIKEEAIKSKEIICPKCREKAIININNYKIDIFGCKNKHKKENISFFDFEKTQLIDESKIECSSCKENNKANAFDKKFFVCNTCKFNLCLLCKLKHNKSHIIIDYSIKDYVCELHNKNYNSYCRNCKMSLCPICSDSPNTKHEISNYKLINKEKKLEQINELMKKIDILNKVKEQIIKEINIFIKYMKTYYNLCKDFINNYDNENRNYEKIENVNKIICSDIVNDIDIIINEKTSLYDKFNKIIEINDIIKNKNIEENNNKETKTIIFGDQSKNKQIIKLKQNINMEETVYSLCYLKKNNLIAMGKNKVVEFYDLSLSLINSYNSLDNKIAYINELMDGKILIVDLNKIIKIVEFVDKKPQLYKKVETKDEGNFVGIEISNKNIICGGDQYLSVIETSFFFRYSLEKSIDLKGFISNIVDINQDCYLVGQSHDRKIIIFSKKTNEPIYQINKIGLRSNNYSISKISNDFVGIAGSENKVSCIFILSIKNKCICNKIYINELICCSTVTRLNNDYFIISGTGLDLDKYNDLILFKKGKGISGNLEIKKIFNFKRSYCDTIEGIISINNFIIGSDSSSNLKIWFIDI